VIIEDDPGSELNEGCFILLGDSLDDEMMKVFNILLLNLERAAKALIDGLRLS